MQLSPRQKKIVEIVKAEGPITGEEVASRLQVTRATLRPDLTILTMAGILEAKPRVGYSYAGQGEGETLAELRRLTVGDVKAVPVVVNQGASAYDALVTMMLEDTGTVFVVDEAGLLTGVVSRQDILRLSLGQADLSTVPVGAIMTRVPQVTTVGPEESVFSAAGKLLAHQVEVLPVVRARAQPGGGKGQEVLGRISKTTITKLFYELGERIL
ncbi:MAG TPA: helix-turn-helix transcriptional regulator [Firmicutes bacterium]|uniref:helix-turn-helix transcriptional regulator n=1 Tax=Gelria sp. Kuro-4 TaxID=2796927 RepID=UPI0019B07DAE|nr:helix-turn-helix transcriptional regulator [Bacillota bacterium]